MGCQESHKGSCPPFKSVRRPLPPTVLGLLTAGLLALAVFGGGVPVVPRGLALVGAQVEPPEPAYVARHRSIPWALPRHFRRRGVVYPGSGHRLEKIASKLLAGEPVTVVAIGGSITVGMGSMGPNYCWAGRVWGWLNQTFPHPQTRVINLGTGGTTSGLYVLCLDKMLPEKVDLVIVEFSINDPASLPFESPERKGFEQLLRKLLHHPWRPSLLLLHTWMWWGARVGTQESGIKGGIYWNGSAENDLLLFGQYYDIPSVSLRAGTYHLQRRQVGNFKVDKILAPNPIGIASPEQGKPGEAFYFDIAHPTDFGHGVLGELVGEALYQAVERLAADRAAAVRSTTQWAWGSSSRSGGMGESGAAREAEAAAEAEREREEMAAAGEEIPPPMVWDNVDIGPSTCFLQESFKGVVVEQSNFTYAPAKPQAATFVAQKWSWSGTAPGAWAELAFDSREDPSQPAPADGGTSRAILGYLKSYESMGTASVECVQGCKCHMTTVDGTWDRHVTLMQMHEFQVTQHPECRVRVTILPETRSGQHKISLVFLLVSTFPVMHYNADHAHGIVTSSVFQPES